MIRWGKWHRKSDGEPLCRIDVPHYLSRSGLAAQLIAANEPHEAADLADLSKSEVEKRIRAQLAFNADAANWLGDDYSEDLCGEVQVTLDQALGWAKRQVAKL